MGQGDLGAGDTCLELGWSCCACPVVTAALVLLAELHLASLSNTRHPDRAFLVSPFGCALEVGAAVTQA